MPVFVQLGAPEKFQLLYELRLATDDKSKERLMNVLKIAAHLGTGLLGPHGSQLVRKSLLIVWESYRSLWHDALPIGKFCVISYV